jgi:hypothetical protein
MKKGTTMRTPRRSRLARLPILVLLMVVALGGTSLANEFAVGIRQLTTVDIDVVKGNQGIRTNPATVNNVGFAHPVQLDIGSAAANFISVGTYKGAGNTSGGCPDNYNNPWSVYVDGVIGGVYFCDRVNPNAYGANTNPTFIIEWGFCPSVSANRWLFSFGGTLWKCLNAQSHAAIAAIAGLETAGTTTDYNIDVKYTSMKISLQGSANFIDFNPNDSNVDLNYFHSVESNTKFNDYLSPLD